MVLDYLKHGKHAAIMKNMLPIGKSILKLEKDQETVTTTELVRALSVKQLGEKNLENLLKIAIDILSMHDLENALYTWVKNTEYSETITTPEQFYEQKTGKKVKFTMEKT
jgi:hypothetical protein